MNSVKSKGRIKINRPSLTTIISKDIKIHAFDEKSSNLDHNSEVTAESSEALEADDNARNNQTTSIEAKPSPECSNEVRERKVLKISYEPDEEEEELDYDDCASENSNEESSSSEENETDDDHSDNSAVKDGDDNDDDLSKDKKYDKKDLPMLVELSIKGFVSQKIQQLEEERIRGEITLAEIEEKMKIALHARQKQMEVEEKSDNNGSDNNENEDDMVSDLKEKKKRKKEKKEKKHKKKKKEEKESKRKDKDKRHDKDRNKKKKQEKDRNKERKHGNDKDKEKKHEKDKDKERKHEKDKEKKHERDMAHSKSYDQIDVDHSPKNRHRSGEKSGYSYVSRLNYHDDQSEGKETDLRERLNKPSRRLSGTSRSNEYISHHDERRHFHRSRSRSKEKDSQKEKRKEESHEKSKRSERHLKDENDAKNRKRSHEDSQNEEDTKSRSSKHIKKHHEVDTKEVSSEKVEQKKVGEEKTLPTGNTKKVSPSSSDMVVQKDNKNSADSKLKNSKVTIEKMKIGKEKKKSAHRKDVKNHGELSKVRTDLEHRVMEASDSEEETDKKIDEIVVETKFRSFSKPLNRGIRMREDAGKESKTADVDDNVEMKFEEEDKVLETKKKMMEEKMRKAAENNKKLEQERKESDLGMEQDSELVASSRDGDSSGELKQTSKLIPGDNKKVNTPSSLKISLSGNAVVSSDESKRTYPPVSATAVEDKESNTMAILKDKKPMIPRVLGLKISEKSAELISSGEKVQHYKDTTDSVEEGELTESNESDGEASSEEHEEGEIDEEDGDDEDDDEGLVEDNDDDDDEKDTKEKKKKKKSSKVGKSKKKQKKGTKTEEKKKGKEKSKDKDKKKKDKSRSRTPKKKKHSAKSRSRSRSRSRSKSKERRRHRSHSRSPDNFWRGSDHRDNRYGGWRDNHNRDHRDYYHDRRRSRSPPFYRGRDKDRRSRSPSLQIDKEALRKIAVANAMKNFRTGQGPAAYLRPDEIARIKSGGKSVAELTEFCKKITQKGGTNDSDGENDDLNNLIGSDEDEGPFINHPFKIRENSSIVMNIKNAKQLPLLTPSEKKAQLSQLRIQFPVSSGNQHRTKEFEWVPVEKPTQPVSTVSTVTASAAKSNTASTANAAAPVTGLNKELSAAMLMPPPPPPPPAPKNDSVFEESVPELINIGEMVSERLSAMKKLSRNPLDMEAMGKMYRAQAKVNKWAQAQNLPGQFTGSTGVKILSVEELEGDRRNQAWLRKDQFIKAPVINNGLGMALLQKMGWKPGEALGKNKEGQLEPLCMEIKMDRKGLSSSDEITRRVPIMLPKGKVPKDLSGKHPVSALTELCKKRRWSPPEFAIASECGPDHKKNFLYKVTVNGVDYQPACGQANKKSARAQAAAACLQALGLLPSA